MTNIFSRSADADNINDCNPCIVGLSCNANWAWGLSIAFGMVIMQSRGVAPAIAWFTANTISVLALSIFRAKVPSSINWVKSQFFYAMVPLFLWVEFFAMVINLHGVKLGLAGEQGVASHPFFNSTEAITMTFIGALALIWYINRRGLRGSVITDIWQYSIQMILVISFALTAYIVSDGQPAVELQMITQKGKDWLPFALLGIFFGSFGALHQHQRMLNIPQDKLMRVGLWSTFFFGIYVVFVLIAAIFFTKSPLLSGFLLAILVVVATSTIDGNVAAMQLVAQRFKLDPRVGSLFALITLLVWPMLADKGLLQLWDIMAQVRWPYIMIAISLTIIYSYVTRSNKKMVSQ